MHTRHTHATSAGRITHISPTRAPRDPCITIQTENIPSIRSHSQHTPYFNPQCLTTPLHYTHSHIHIQPSHDNRLKNICMRYIHTAIVFLILATRGNNKILRTPPQEEITKYCAHLHHTLVDISPPYCRTLAQLRDNHHPFSNLT